MKIITFYLPQFHKIKENDEWWGDGFTEWVNVKNAKKLFNNHNQPRVPLNNNYYNLDDITVMINQAKLAKKYGIYGFCYYHYWFEGKLLLEKPLENMLSTSEVNIPFCLSWANETWTRTWADKSKSLLLEQTYGDEKDWTDHFYYLLPFFKDKRYIYKDGCPLFVIYRPHNISCCREMLNLWEKLAINNGLNGITFVYQDRSFNHLEHEFGDLFDYGIEYQPQIVMDIEQHTIPMTINRSLNILADKVPIFQNKYTCMRLSYDSLWKRILKYMPRDEKMFPGAFVDWDNTPRYKNRGSICIGVTPEKFGKYLNRQIKRAKKVYKKDMIFMFAWNEWGEGGYLEPDDKYEYEMLEKIKDALEVNDEFEY